MEQETTGTGAAPRELDARQIDARELRERVELIEAMLREGRRSTHAWGWTFVLWGVAYLVAVGWSAFLPGGPLLAWPVTMSLAVLLAVLLARRVKRRHPRNERGRAIAWVWTGIGTAIFCFAFPVSFSGHYQPQSFTAGIEAMLGAAHLVSGGYLRWRIQMAVGALWLAAAAGGCWLSADGVVYLFLAATLVCNIGFGTFLMLRERQILQAAPAVARG
jgi:hypothetical protein